MFYMVGFCFSMTDENSHPLFAIKAILSFRHSIQRYTLPCYNNTVITQYQVSSTQQMRSKPGMRSSHVSGNITQPTLVKSSMKSFLICVRIVTCVMTTFHRWNRCQTLSRVSVNFYSVPPGQLPWCHYVHICTYVQSLTLTPPNTSIYPAE